MFLSCVVRTGERFGAGHVISVLRGEKAERISRLGHDKLSTYGIGRDRAKQDWHLLARELLREGYLRQSGDRFAVLKVGEHGRAALRGAKVMLALRETAAPTPAPVVAEPDRALFEALRTLRRRLATERGVPPYVIFPDTALKQMAAELPRTRAELLRVKGVGERRAADFGAEFLSVIADFLTTR
jgi:ATP-dependent DNA helicase RecQ